MSFWRFFRDRLFAVCVFIITWAMLMIFLLALSCGISALIATSSLLLIGGTITLLWDFLRRRDFYNRINTSLESLDNKYLISEMIPDPDFADGEILRDIISEACRSMYESVAEQKRNTVEFREFIELWVHEIKLPVAGLLLMCHNGGEKAAEYVPQLMRIDDHIENVLFYARSENAEKDYIIKEVSLKKAFSAAAMKNINALQKRGVSIQAKGLDVKVLTDGKWLEYILGQFISNSIKYFTNEREPEINVRASVTSNRTELRFRDNGCGIPASDLPYIFEKTFTGENGRRGSRSTGMGLYIVRSLCNRLGHGISAESVPGEYTEMILSFGSNDHLKME
jgi:hypothetical protein